MTSTEDAVEAEAEASLCRVLTAAEEVLRCVARPQPAPPPTSRARGRSKTEMQAALKEARCVLHARRPPRSPVAPQGWFSLARARYQMGAGSVGQLQYDQNMRACVRLTQSDSDWSLLSVEEGDSSESTLRRRRAPPGEPAKPGAVTPRLPQAPLRWFAGPMPPPALRSAQQHFWRALGLAVEAANAQAQVARRLDSASAHLKKEASAAEQNSEAAESAAQGEASSHSSAAAAAGESEAAEVSSASMQALSLSSE